jgi:hypothetical protein
MRQIFFLITAALFLSFAGINVASGQKIYLSPDGNDRNPGTIDQPLSTLTAARNRARALRSSGSTYGPVEIIAMKGEYFMFQPLILTSEDSGSADAPLIIKADEGTKAVFRGGVQLFGTEKINDHLWRIFIPQVAWYDSYFEQLYVNGRRAVRARTPDKGFYMVKNSAEDILVRGGDRIPELAVQKIELNPSDARCLKTFTAGDYRDAVITFYHKWDNTMKHITGFNDSTSTIYTTGTGMQSWNTIDSQSRYYIDNFRSALDAPGEWYLDRSGYLYYIPMDGETIENTSFFAPVLKEFVVIRGDSAGGERTGNIQFENLIFEMSGYQMPPQGNEAAQAASPIGASVTVDYANNVSFSNCEIAHTGNYAFWFRRACSNCSVEHSCLHDLGAGGIKIGETVIRPDTAEITRHITVDNNIITDGGHIFPSAVGIIIFNASDNRLTHNEISNLRYSGVSVGWVWGYAPSPSKRNIVEFNHIHHLGWGELCDMGGVYTLGASEGTSVSNNVIHHVYTFDYGGWGLYTDEGSYGITEENNLVYACKSAGFHQHYGKENIIRNNIFAFNIRSQLQATRIEDHTSIIFTHNIVCFNNGSLLSSNWSRFNLKSDYNCYWDTSRRDIDFGKTFAEWKKEGKDVHSIIADPRFVDPLAYDFHFKSLSVVKKIKFKPFDYTMAGVYGSEEWKKLAAFDPALAREFDAIVDRRESAK